MTTFETKTATSVAPASTLTKNQIALQRGFVCQMSNENTIKGINLPSLLSKQEKLSIQAELMQFGYMLSEDALDAVSLTWFEDIMSYLKKSLGVGNYLPFYKNFPKQVMELSHTELFMNAILHYWSEGTWEASYELQERGFKFENTKFTTIKLGTEKDFANIFTTLVSINQSITENDKKVVEWFIANYRDNLVMPKNIPFKETLCMLAGHGLNVPIANATDVLRIAVYFSGGDISLPAIPKLTIGEVLPGRRSYFFKNLKESQITAKENFKFKNLTRSRRKYLLALLENTNVDLGEMKQKIGRWLRLGEILHVGEYKTRFPKAYEAFDMLRNAADEIQTYESKVQEALTDADKDEHALQTALWLLSKKPGVFARKLDFLLRNYDNQVVLTAFEKIATKVSKKVLWELYNHFLNRDSSKPRMIMIKGKKSIKKALKELSPMDKITINKIQNTILKCVSYHFGQLESLGNVWIDQKLKKIPLPTAMRSVNTSVKTYVRGTRIPFNENAKVIRPYIHWFDQYGNEDLDLSVGFYTKNLQGVDHLSYTNLKIESFNSCHSGDVRQRRGACAEYVDIDIATCLKMGVRYAMVQVHNFQNRPMHSMKDCVFGMMEREFPESNLVFVPKTITNAVAVANESSTVCIAVLDLQEKEYIWLDLELQSRGLANIESTKSEIGQIIRGVINSESLSVYDILLLHAQSRGKVVAKAEDAKTKFEYDDFVTSYDKIATFM
jgi:hypothetical protein